MLIVMDNLTVRTDSQYISLETTKDQYSVKVMLDDLMIAMKI